jgi:nanoRNase/pAp phosphatase (c-di-AMP/oligoRNAs hydrolase)
MTGERPTLLLITDRPRLFERARVQGRRVVRWAPDGGGDGEPPGEGAFTGDPTRAATYAALSCGAAPLAVVALHECARALAVAEALGEAYAEPALLLLCDGPAKLPAGMIGVCRPWSDLVQMDLEQALDLLDARRRVARLEAFAGGARVVPIYIHHDPDPDALASAIALRTLLERKASSSPIVCSGEITRPENRRMAELLRIQVTEVSAAELARYERLMVVDTQPRPPLGRDGQRLAVIDHHPQDAHCPVELADIRPHYGATATILTEYLRGVDERRIRRPLATALLYGIKTDTASLSRGVSAADVRAYAFLQERSDPAMLRRVERPAYREALVRAFGRALADVAVDGDLAVAYVGAMEDEETHLLADVADFCLAMEGIAWVGAGARVGDRVVVNLRHLGGGPGAGGLARRLAQNGGTGGGHATMARVVLPPQEVAGEGWSGAAEALLLRLREEIERLDGG